MQISYCVIAFLFIGASVYTMLTCKSCSPFVEFTSALNDEQKTIYQSIIAERQRIYVHGLVLGTILSLFYLYFATGMINPFAHGCVFVAIALTVQYFYYTFVPKRQLIVTNLETEDKRRRWLDVYNHMKMRYHIGMLLGLLGYGAFAYATN